jgi:hypothetical protein
MVDPNVRGVLDCNHVFERRWHLLMHCVADDDVGRIYNREANADDFCDLLAIIRRGRTMDDSHCRRDR